MTTAMTTAMITAMTTAARRVRAFAVSLVQALGADPAHRPAGKHPAEPGTGEEPDHRR